MKQLRFRLRDAAREQGVPQEVIEKDYAMSYLLAAISTEEKLGRSLVLKGGTALKKLFFGDYRFSEDLDFSARGAPTGERLEESLGRTVAKAGQLLSVHGPFVLQVERYLKREPHPHGRTPSLFGRSSRGTGRHSADSRWRSPTMNPSSWSRSCGV
jgi:predicted nucleotidyltransferase component of viral defense system